MSERQYIILSEENGLHCWHYGPNVVMEYERCSQREEGINKALYRQEIKGSKVGNRENKMLQLLVQQVVVPSTAITMRIFPWLGHDVSGLFRWLSIYWQILKSGVIVTVLA
jgi:hypothetical protein